MYNGLCGNDICWQLAPVVHSAGAFLYPALPAEFLDFPIMRHDLLRRGPGDLILGIDGDPPHPSAVATYDRCATRRKDQHQAYG